MKLLITRLGVGEALVVVGAGSIDAADIQGEFGYIHADELWLTLRALFHTFRFRSKVTGVVMYKLKTFIMGLTFPNIYLSRT